MTAARRSNRDTGLAILLLALVIALAAGLRFYQLGSQSLWADEGNSAALASRAFAQIARDAANDIHPPLYYWLLHVWTALFGASETALRAFSAMCGVLVVAVTFEIGRRTFGLWTGLIAAFIAAISPFQIYYSQEARMYALLALEAALSVLLAWIVMTREDRKLPVGGTTAADTPPPSISHAGSILTSGDPDSPDQESSLVPENSVGSVASTGAGPGQDTAADVIGSRPVSDPGEDPGGSARHTASLLSEIPGGCVGGTGREETRSTPSGRIRAAPVWIHLPALLLVLTWAAGLYTHYAFPVVIALLTLVYLVWLLATRQRGFVNRRLGRWMLWILLALLLYLPWFMTEVRQVGGWGVARPAVALAQQLASEVSVILFGPLEHLRGAFWLIPLLALIGLVPWPYRSRQGQTGSPRMDAFRILLPFAWLVVPIAAILALGLFREAYLKFLMVAAPAGSLLLSHGLVGPAGWLGSLGSKASASDAPLTPTQRPEAGAWWAWVVAIAWVVGGLALIIGASGPALARYYGDPGVARDDYRGMARFIQATAGTNDAVLLTAPGQRDVFNYYHSGRLPVYPLPRSRPLDPEATSQELGELLTHDKIYALFWAIEEADPARVIPSWLDTRGYKTMDQWRGNVRLAVYVMPSQEPPEESAQPSVRFGDRITLAGYEGWNLTPASGEVTQLRLMWRADAPLDREYKVFVQLLDARDQVVAQRDAQPVGEARPTTGWMPDEEIVDNHGLLIPPGTPPGSYRRIVGLYDAETLERLKLPDGKDHFSLAPVTVSRADSPPSAEALDMLNADPFDYGGIALLGHDRYKRGYLHLPDEPLRPGDLLHMTLYWQAKVEPRADWWFDLTLNDSSGDTVAAVRAPLVSDTYPTTLWQAGEVVRGEHDLLLPPELAPDTYRLSLTLYPDELTPVGTAYLGQVRVQ